MTRRRHLTRPRLIAAVLILGVLLPGTAAAQDSTDEPLPTLPSDELPTPGLPVEDDTGVVHSWALTPGDGSIQAGERPNLNYELPPGGTVDDVVTLYNFSNVQLTFGVYATDAFNNDDGSFNLLPSDQQPTDVGTWLTMPIDSVTIPAGQRATFPISIRVPADAAPGDHVGALLAASTAFGTGADNTVVNLDRRTGTRLYVRVTGQLRSELSVEKLEVEYDAVLNPLAGNARVSYEIVNRGNVRLSGTQQVSVAGPLGLHRVQLDAEQIPELLPGEKIVVERALSGVWATGIASGTVEVTPRSVVGDDRLEPVTRSSSSGAPPYLLLAILTLAILSGLARRAYRRHRDAPGVEVVVPVETVREHEPV